MMEDEFVLFVQVMGMLNAEGLITLERVTLRGNSEEFGARREEFGDRTGHSPLQT